MTIMCIGDRSSYFWKTSGFPTGRGIAFRFDVLELNTNVKPSFLITVIKVRQDCSEDCPCAFYFLEQFYIPWLVLRYGIEVVHSLHYSFPLLPLSARKIVTIHDLTSFHLPHLHVPMKRRYYKFFISMSRMNACAVSLFQNPRVVIISRCFLETHRLVTWSHLESEVTSVQTSDRKISLLP